MLGHTKAVGDPEDVFKLIPRTLSDTDRVMETFVRYSARYPVLVPLRAAVKAENFARFLTIFGGMTMKIPKDVAGVTELSLLPEVTLFFGEDVTQNVVSTFGGKTVKIPPLHLVINSVRDTDIYIRVTEKRTSETIRELAKHYELTRYEVWWVFRRVASTINPKANLDNIEIPDDSPE